ncbi:Chitinase 1 [Arthrobotrys musiformis]|uniref:chitinase n=1 Tax=Arthrobotrys musiformis TaxID=47236 RepID=A0AAV9WER1_9PEZI
MPSLRSTLTKALLRSIVFFPFVPQLASGFDIQGTNNVALYWGQNSAQISPQSPLKSYCDRPDVDILILSFISLLYSNEKIPILNQATPQCFPIPGSAGGQVSCPELAQEIEYCKGKGKKILVSLGGATGGYELLSSAEAAAAAKQVWDTYLGGGQGGMAVRPFGEVEVDGVDLDLESPPGVEGTHWPVFIDTIRSLYQTEAGRNGKKDYLVTASPQCVYPDVILSPALRDKRSWFDMLFIQFYNNQCAPTNPSSFNFNQWAEWARSSSLNPSVKLFIGAPAAPSAAPSGGFTPLESLLEIASDSMEDCENARVFWNGDSMATNSTNPYNPFGGIAFWDASWTTPEYTAATKFGLTGSWEKAKARNQIFRREELERDARRPGEENEAESAAERKRKSTRTPTRGRTTRIRHSIRRRHRHRR